MRRMTSLRDPGDFLFVLRRKRYTRYNPISCK
jgi:hypothetical protein